MINIKRKHILCEKHDICYSKKSGCKICKLDIDNYYKSSEYMREKIFVNFKNDLIGKIKKKFRHHSHMEILKDILNNSTDKRIIKFKMIMEEKEKIRYVKDLKFMCPKFFRKSVINDLYNKTKN